VPRPTDVFDLDLPCDQLPHSGKDASLSVLAASISTRNPQHHDRFPFTLRAQANWVQII